MTEQRINHVIHLKQHPVGIPTESNFESVKTTVPIPTEGEFLVRNIWVSVDPYMRGRMREMKSYISPFQFNISRIDLQRCSVFEYSKENLNTEVLTLKDET